MINIRSTNWVVERVKFMGQNGLRIHANLKFINREPLDEIPEYMWEELSKFMNERKFMFIYSCNKTFQGTDIKNFYIPERYSYLFDEVVECKDMFGSSLVETITLDLKSNSLNSADYICSECRRLKHLDLTFGRGRLSIIKSPIYKCESLITAKITFNSSHLAIFDLCRDNLRLTSLLLKFERPCIAIHNYVPFNMINIPKLKWFRIVGRYEGMTIANYEECESLLWEPTGFNLDCHASASWTKNHRFRYCHTLQPHQLSTYMIHVISSKSKNPNCKSLIV